jgi:hypothetical protein
MNSKYQTGEVSEKGLQPLLQKSTNLKHFCFSNGLDEMDYMNFIQTTDFPHSLEDLSLLISNIGLYCPKLRSLHLEHVPLVCDKHQEFVVCPCLTTITMEGRYCHYYCY